MLTTGTAKPLTTGNDGSSRVPETGDEFVLWAVLCFTAWFLMLILVPLRELKRLWPAAIIGMAAVYAVDSTLIGLGAFSYARAGPALSGVPLFYLLSVAAATVPLAYHYPDGARRQAVFVAAAALVFLLVEAAMVALRYFHHLSWSLWRSYLLDVGGFIVVLWLARLAGAAGRHPAAGRTPVEP